MKTDTKPKSFYEKYGYRVTGHHYWKIEDQKSKVYEMMKKLKTDKTLSVTRIPNSIK